MGFSKNFYLFSITILTIVFSDVQADVSERQFLFGDWDGRRATWEEKGLTFENVITYDLLSVRNGGIKHGEIGLGNLDLTAALDTSKAKLWEGGTFFMYFLGNAGAQPSEWIGDTQGADNIQAPETLKLYEFWYDQSFFDGKVSFLVGLHDYNSEFDALDYGGNLINSSFGITVDISQVGPSIFPTTSLAGRLKFQPNDNFYVQAAVYDGTPGDPNDDRGTQVILKSSDGLFYAAETGLVSSEDAPHYKAALGGWYHTTDFEDFNGVSQDNNGGIYVIGESSIYQEEDTEQGLGIFFQSSFTHSDRNQIGSYYGLGFSYTGLIQGRDSDILAFGFNTAFNGNGFRSANPDLDKSEKVLELNYHLSITPYLTITPDVQYIINPGTDPELEDAVVFIIRTEVAL